MIKFSRILTLGLAMVSSTYAQFTFADEQEPSAGVVCQFYDQTSDELPDAIKDLLAQLPHGFSVLNCSTAWGSGEILAVEDQETYEKIKLFRARYLGHNSEIESALSRERAVANLTHEPIDTVFYCLRDHECEALGDDGFVTTSGITDATFTSFKETWARSGASSLKHIFHKTFPDAVETEYSNVRVVELVGHGGTANQTANLAVYVTMDPIAYVAQAELTKDELTFLSIEVSGPSNNPVWIKP